MSLHGQNKTKSFSKEWKRVDEFVKKGLPKSALTELDGIYKKANKEKNNAQLIKVLIYRAELNQQIDEEPSGSKLPMLKRELENAREPARSILHSLLAEVYQDFYEMYRWSIMNRTRVEGQKSDDVDTWTASDFMETITEHYLASIADEKLLKSTRLDDYEAILIKGNSRHLRPTLFDLLAHRALGFFTSEERTITKPIDNFEIGQAEAFAPAPEFVKVAFRTKDSLSVELKALQLYQQLINFHLTDQNPAALIDIDLDRISFVYQKSVHPDKDELYLKALEQLAGKYPNAPEATQASYLIAQWYKDKAQTYAPFQDTTYRYAAVKAWEIATNVASKLPKSEGGINLQNLKTEIEEQMLNFQIGKVNIPHKPFLLSLEYRNAKEVFFRVIRRTPELKAQYENEGREKFLQVLDRENPVKQWSVALPQTNDYQSHRVELKVDALPAGDYYLVASGGQKLSDTTKSHSFQSFQVSDIAFINLSNDFYVLHRDSGQPLSGVEVQVWKRVYDTNAGKYLSEKGRSYKTDANGFFRLDSASRNSQFTLEFIHGDDRLTTEETFTYHSNGRDREATPDIFFFTDRSIYRPGQTVYFKGIVLQRKKNEKGSEILSKHKVTVKLYDANRQVVDTLSLTTSEYGTVAGTFQLPVSGLNGRFGLSADKINGQASFNVEDYKRPRFKVEIPKPEQVVRVNETVQLTGEAKAFAGNSIDGAVVRYRVERQPRFPYFRWYWIPVKAPAQIAHGETITDSEGKFRIEFTAIPDKTISRESDPVFDYVIYANVTDGAGETRSAIQVVTVGYKAVLLKTTLPERVENLSQLQVKSENTNGVFVPVQVKAEARRLVPEPRLIRERHWERPDQFVMTKEEFIRLFPNDEYDNESNLLTWEKGETIALGEQTTREDGNWNLPANLDLNPGFYELVFTAVASNGDTIQDIRTVEVFTPASNQLTRPQYLWTRGSDKTEPGETSLIRMGTSSDSLYILQTLENSDGRKNSQTTRLQVLKKGIHELSFPISEADRGGFGVTFAFVKHNRVYVHQETIKVPWSNKKLTITYGTFRDKTLPGSRETWNLTLAGFKGEKVAAELLAGMYDASLDEFLRHEWRNPGVWPNFYPMVYWGTRAFGSKSAEWYPGKSRRITYFDKSYDELIEWPQYRISDRNMILYESALPRSMATPAPAMEKVAIESARLEETVVIGYGDAKADPVPSETVEQPTRKDFRETVFFYPELRTDADGNVQFSFTMPEALTKWKFQAFGHTKELAMGLSSQEIVTQKQLMVQPNIPRFVRQGDQVLLSTKVVNLSEKELSGTVKIELLDAESGNVISSRFGLTQASAGFSLKPGQSTALSFPVEVPEDFLDPITVRFVAQAGSYSDGEDNAVPVLTNRMLVTESLPLSLRGSGTRNFELTKLINSQSGQTLRHHAVTVEYTANPAWYAVQSLPYLMEYPYDCAEQTWNRYYANALASHIVSASPRIEQIFKTWRDLDSTALLSNLQKNQELKSLLLQETPWVLDARNEAAQKRNLALLMDLVKMKNDGQTALDKLKQMQLGDGSFPWFKGGPEDRFITQYILSGIGHLGRLAPPDSTQRKKLMQIVESALAYVDSRFAGDYEDLVKEKVDLKKYTLSYMQVHYLYMRSFFPDVETTERVKKARDYFLSRLPDSWVDKTKYVQGMAALALSRWGNVKAADAVMKSLKETAVNHPEQGTHWSSVKRSWWWQDAKIETHALLVEAFEEVAKDAQTADDIRTWLLTQKRTNRWESTKATAEACYALLLRGADWLHDNPQVDIRFGSLTLSSEQGAEAGTGYVKSTIKGEEVQPEMGNIQVSVSGTAATQARPSWGGVYWQYFENLDKITFSETGLKLKKQLFVERNSDRGPVLTELQEGNEVKVGDRLKVRIVLTVDQDMEYVHMKDMRASGLEPVNVISSYKWQGRLSYYESTRDAATNFFFSFLPKGTYVFEYPLNVTHQGDFTNGITTIQCMYAPEFTAHSEGMRLKVK